MPEIEFKEDGAPPGFRRFQERDTFLIAREEFADAVHKIFAPLYQAWPRMAQRRFTAHGRAGIVTFPLEGGKNLVARRYVHGGLIADIGKDLYFGPDRALNELVVAENAARGKVHTPAPVGILAQRRRGPLWRLAFLTLEVPESEDLVHYCCRLSEYPGETTAAEKRSVIREAARQIRRMHDVGITHADLHLKNLLLQRREDLPPDVYIIDFDRARAGGVLDAEMRLGNIRRLARSVRKVRVADTLLTPWDKIRFLREYLQGRPEGKALLRQWAKRLKGAGRMHQAWWAASGAKRNVRGDSTRRNAGTSLRAKR